MPTPNHRPMLFDLCCLSANGCDNRVAAIPRSSASLHDRSSSNCRSSDGVGMPDIPAVCSLRFGSLHRHFGLDARAFADRPAFLVVGLWPFLWRLCCRAMLAGSQPAELPGRRVVFQPICLAVSFCYRHVFWSTKADRIQHFNTAPRLVAGGSPHIALFFRGEKGAK